MNEIETTKHRLEILKMARELANEEYINKRAEDHNDWLAKVDVAWRTRGVRLPYPPFVPYPTEADIVARAVTLYKFVTPTPSSKPDIPAAETASPEPRVDAPVAPPIVEPPVADPAETPPVKRALSWDTFTDHTVAVEDLIVDTPGETVTETTVAETVAVATESTEQTEVPAQEDVSLETSIFPSVTDTAEEQLEPTIKSPNKPALTGIKNLLALGWLKNSNDKGA